MAENRNNKAPLHIRRVGPPVRTSGPGIPEKTHSLRKAAEKMKKVNRKVAKAAKDREGRVICY